MYSLFIPGLQAVPEDLCCRQDKERLQCKPKGLCFFSGGHEFCTSMACEDSTADIMMDIKEEHDFLKVLQNACPCTSTTGEGSRYDDVPVECGCMSVCACL
ncbi:hypothetical protein AAES_79856 [Amazona aestiva]|uniref:Uncharacterized protein n=1 Tax=Amazona aestiva TaxID=12930 RepID=A0A0Q3Q054_AMAAE|nr:hypothetical protein AAES_79856 [Amazona aestiva]